jgi:hypothetical protein
MFSGDLDAARTSRAFESPRQLIFVGLGSGRGTDGRSRNQRQEDIFRPRPAAQVTMNLAPQCAVKLTGDDAGEKK